MFALAIHGGAGVDPAEDYSVEVEHLQQLLTAGRQALGAKTGALDVVCQMVKGMEVSGLYVAGKGSSANLAGVYELDASVMLGPTKDCGAVCALQDVESPVEAARAVMEKSPHVLLAGEGATVFARGVGLKTVDSTYYRSVATSSRVRHHGTVGAVALDVFGQMAAATSTGGTFGKMPGRVGDSPLIGCATWADERVAVSCTGHGEFFVRSATAKDVADRVSYAGLGLKSACDASLDEVARLGGDGGLIAVDPSGAVVLGFNSHGMKSGYVTASAPPWAGVFDTMFIQSTVSESPNRQ